MNPTVKQYILGLQKAYLAHGGQQTWTHFERTKQGLTLAEINELVALYPHIPEGLIGLLEYVDGTYWRMYAGEEIHFYFLGSDLSRYPYFLLSSREIVANKNLAFTYYSDYIDQKYEMVEIDEKITKEASTMHWLHFSDCTNNGGTSQLFIDFSPSEKGKIGQIVRFLHDPDELSVIADSFDDYLKKVIEHGFDFINEGTCE